MAETLAPAVYGRANPFPGRMLVNHRLNPGSQKDTRHLEIDLTGWGLSYEVGDSLSVLASNDPALVDEVLQAICAKGDELVPSSSKDKPPLPLREALLREYRITQPTPKFLKAIAERASAAPLLKELLHADRKQDLDTYLYGMEVIDFLHDHHSVRFTPEEFVGLLTKQQPRLYSISSSLKAFPEQVHLTVDVVRYESNGRVRSGVCSSFLAERADDCPIPVFPNASKFRLPDDPNTDIIMVGPGTGIAPFRAFLQERKIYVQHRMLENTAELWKWLDEGAHFFVCGDAKRMAKDVDAALHKIVQEHGGKNPEQASEYVEQMKKEKRYKRDVY